MFRNSLGSKDHTIRLWNPFTGDQVRKPLTGHENSVTSVAFSPKGDRLASGSYDNTVRLWDPFTGDQIGKPLTGHGDPVLSVAFSPKGDRLASGSSNNTVAIWERRSTSTGFQWCVVWKSKETPVDLRATGADLEGATISLENALLLKQKEAKVFIEE